MKDLKTVFDKNHTYVLIGDDICTKKVQTIIQYVKKESIWTKLLSLINGKSQPENIMTVTNESTFATIERIEGSVRVMFCSSMEPDLDKNFFELLSKLPENHTDKYILFIRENKCTDEQILQRNESLITNPQIQTFIKHSKSKVLPEIQNTYSVPAALILLSASFRFRDIRRVKKI